MLQAGVTTIMHKSSRYKDKEYFFWIGVRENLNWNPLYFMVKKDVYIKTMVSAEDFTKPIH